MEGISVRLEGRMTASFFSNMLKNGFFVVMLTMYDNMRTIVVVASR